MGGPIIFEGTTDLGDLVRGEHLLAQLGHPRVSPEVAREVPLHPVESGTRSLERDLPFHVIEQRGEGDLSVLYHSADTWEVGPEGQEITAGKDTRDLEEMSLLEGTPMVPGVAHETDLSQFQHLVTDPISTLTLKKAVTVSADTTVDKAVDLMKQEKIGYVLVTDEDGRLSGLFAEGDVFYKVAGSDLDAAEVPVGNLMTRDPIALLDRLGPAGAEGRSGAGVGAVCRPRGAPHRTDRPRGAHGAGDGRMAPRVMGRRFS